MTPGPDLSGRPCSGRVARGGIRLRGAGADRRSRTGRSCASARTAPSSSPTSVRDQVAPQRRRESRIWSRCACPTSTPRSHGSATPVEPASSKSRRPMCTASAPASSRTSRGHRWELTQTASRRRARGMGRRHRRLMVSGKEPSKADEVRDATRRTRLANERTYLAWRRTGPRNVRPSAARRRKARPRTLNRRCLALRSDRNSVRRGRGDVRRRWLCPAEAGGRSESRGAATHRSTFGPHSRSPLSASSSASRPSLSSWRSSQQLQPGVNFCVALEVAYVTRTGPNQLVVPSRFTALIRYR